MADQLTPEVALNWLNQAGLALETIVKAKEAISAALQANQNRANLEKQNAALKAWNQTLEQQRDELNLAMDREKTDRQAGLADLMDQGLKQFEADRTEQRAVLAKLKGQITAQNAALENLETTYQERLQALKTETAQAEERLNQASADYEAIKARFRDS
jgi:chromosome segregation ATPase